MSTVVSYEAIPARASASSSQQAQLLAERLEQGARALVRVASGLSDSQWKTRMPVDGRTVGVIVHHVASVYPVEIQLAQILAQGRPVENVTMQTVHEMNAAHALEHAEVTREEAINLLEKNSAAAAAAIRALSDEQLRKAAPASLYSGAPVTCQFMLEDHAVRHSYHHLLRIRNLLHL
jgi:hypothetical protein